MTSKKENSILANYEMKIIGQQCAIADLKSSLTKFSFVRLGSFISEILSIALIAKLGFFWATGALAALPIVVFLAVVKKQARLEKHLQYAKKLLWIYQNETDHLTDKGNGYAEGTEYNDESHPYASDLDITGTGSLFSYINRCSMRDGMDLLAKNLLKANDRYSIVKRQQAIGELIRHIDQTFIFRAHLLGHQSSQLTTLKNKFGQELPWQLKFTEGSFIRFYAIAGPILTVLLFLSSIIIGQPIWIIFGMAIAFNGAAMLFYIKSINRLHNGFSGSSSLLNAFSETIKWQEDIQWQSPYIKDLLISRPHRTG